MEMENRVQLSEKHTRHPAHRIISMVLAFALVLGLGNWAEGFGFLTAYGSSGMGSSVGSSPSLGESGLESVISTFEIGVAPSEANSGAESLFRLWINTGGAGTTDLDIQPGELQVRVTVPANAIITNPGNSNYTLQAGDEFMAIFNQKVCC